MVFDKKSSILCGMELFFCAMSGYKFHRIGDTVAIDTLKKRD